MTTVYKEQHSLGYKIFEKIKIRCNFPGSAVLQAFQ